MTDQPQESSTRDERVDEAILAYLEEVDAGRLPDPDDFVARYPDIAGELRDYLADHDHISRATHEWRQSRGARRNGATTLSGQESSVADVSDRLPDSIGGYRPLRLLGAGRAAPLFVLNNSRRNRGRIPVFKSLDHQPS